MKKPLADGKIAKIMEKSHPKTVQMNEESVFDQRLSPSETVMFSSHKAGFSSSKIGFKILRRR